MKTGLFLFITLAVVFSVVSAHEPYPHIESECAEPNDCHYSETCHKNRCVHACELRNSNELGNKCGENAGCWTKEPHSAICGCQPLHIGDPDVGCKKVSYAEFFADLKRRNSNKTSRQSFI